MREIHRKFIKYKFHHCSSKIDPMVTNYLKKTAFLQKSALPIFFCQSDCLQRHIMHAVVDPRYGGILFYGGFLLTFLYATLGRIDSAKPWFPTFSI